MSILDLEAYYQINTGWTDKSGNNYNGTNNGASINTTDQKLGAGCGEFNGINNKITFSSFFNPTGMQKMSIDGWIKNYDGANRGVFGWWTGSQGFFLQTTADGLLVLAGDGGDNASVAFDTTSDHVYFVLTFDGAQAGNANRLKLDLNNVQQSLTFVGGAGIPSQLGTISTTPEMGNIPTLARYWDGLIDDLGVYSNTLSQDFKDFRYNNENGNEISFGSPSYYYLQQILAMEG